MTRVLHTGDTHLGYQQYHEPQRRQDFLAAFERVVEDAIAEDVDAVVHAGDLFHDRQPRLPDIMGALSVLRTLDDAGIPFLAVVGNHETKRDAQWLDLYESLGFATRLGSSPVVVGDVAVYGLDFVPESQRAALEYDFEPHDAESAVLVSHGLFAPFDYGDWDATEILDASPVDFDAVLLGDDHEAKQTQVDGTWLTYCGSTERASASERAERGYNLVDFTDGVDIRRRGLPTREFVFVDVELADGEGHDRVQERVGQHDLEDAVVIVAIEGEGDPITPGEIETFALDRGALVARVNDRREIAADAETTVSFADPDDAVAERIRDLGLSAAARDIDETIRASKVADSTVADTVEQRVREIVDEADPAAFESAETPTDDGESTAGDEAEGGQTDDQATMEEYL
ncbi:exonuclease SbcCD subunit D [Halapricum sp. CBA1109]|uniref:DNA double-strand break repair protein Mre11 n=1 Tax=Halapricum sp. CBA1109 TaxID=2668068 RepID=UPI0012FB9EE5|nr:DNA double-strand break repair protein Mre11 [Halapricum sp. CBA1109]MUV90419.1 exonuclease SbcCD subunit D [Halapricum sp. CBA1109]